VPGSSNENDEDADVGTVAGGVEEAKDAAGVDESACAATAARINTAIRMKEARRRRMVRSRLEFSC
jgi:trehalose-6-phosphate synthase